MKNNVPGQSKETKTVAFVCTALSSFKFLLLSGVTQYAQERRGIAVLIVEPDDVRNNTILGNCNGIIVNVPDRNIIETLTATGLPIVDTGCERDCSKGRLRMLLVRRLVSGDSATPRCVSWTGRWTFQRSRSAARRSSSRPSG